MIDVQNLINEAIERNNQVKAGGRDSNYFHVSDAGTCYRKRFYKRLNVDVPNEIPIANLRKMVAGDAGHEKLQYLLRSGGNLFASENEISAEHIKGHFDGIVREGDQLTLLEIKTIEKFSMRYIKEGGPKPEHEMQMFTYWHLLRKYYTNLNSASLSYVKREDFESKDFNYTYTDDLAEKVLAEWNPLIGFWKDQKLPPCTCAHDYNGNGIKYCRYQVSDELCCPESLFDKQLFEKFEVTNA